MDRKPTDLRQVARYLTAALFGMALSGIIQLFFTWPLGVAYWIQQGVFLVLVFTTVIIGGVDQRRRKMQQERQISGSAPVRRNDEHADPGG
jgi:heme A synthase